MPAHGQFHCGNVGDEFQRLLCRRAYDADLVLADDGPRLFGVGSILQRARSGDIVWGSGAKTRDLPWSTDDAQKITLVMVRGPLSAEAARRAGASLSHLQGYCDPGSLIGDFFTDLMACVNQDRCIDQGIVLVPHFRDALAFRKEYHKHKMSIVDVDQPLVDFLEAIRGAKLVVSSSLHGLIFAEALGIPAMWHHSFSGEPVFKFEDYFLGSGRSTWHTVRSYKDICRTTPLRAPIVDKASAWASLPKPSMLMANGVLF
jgi:hypothetical protein